MTKNIKQIAVLDKKSITTSEILLYLESINLENEMIVGVLKREPAMPGYEQLEWFLNSKIDIKITKKLKTSQKLDMEERLHLKETLLEASLSLKRLKRLNGTLGQTQGLEEYIKTL